MDIQTLKREAMTLLLKAEEKKKQMISMQDWLDMNWKIVVREKMMPEITKLKNLASEKIAIIRKMEQQKPVKKEEKPLVSAMDQMKSLYISQ